MYCPKNVFFITNELAVQTTSRGGATVLKVGGTILRAEREKNFLTPPHTFWPVGGQNIA